MKNKLTSVMLPVYEYEFTYKVSFFVVLNAFVLSLTNQQSCNVCAQVSFAHQIHQRSNAEGQASQL